MNAGSLGLWGLWGLWVEDTIATGTFLRIIPGRARRADDRAFVRGMCESGRVRPAWFEPGASQQKTPHEPKILTGRHRSPFVMVRLVRAMTWRWPPLHGTRILGTSSFLFLFCS